MSFYNYSSGDLGTRRSYRGGIPGIGNERSNVFLCVRAASDGPVFLCGCPKRPKSETRLSCRLSTTPANAAFGLILREISGKSKHKGAIKEARKSI